MPKALEIDPIWDFLIICSVRLRCTNHCTKVQLIQAAV